MRTIVIIAACFFLAAVLGCERADKAIETYKKAREDAREVKEDAARLVRDAKEEASNMIDKKAKEFLDGKRQGKSVKEENDNSGKKGGED